MIKGVLSLIYLNFFQYGQHAECDSVDAERCGLGPGWWTDWTRDGNLHRINHTMGGATTLDSEQFLTDSLLEDAVFWIRLSFLRCQARSPSNGSRHTQLSGEDFDKRIRLLLDILDIWWKFVRVEQLLLQGLACYYCAFMWTGESLLCYMVTRDNCYRATHYILAVIYLITGYIYNC